MPSIDKDRLARLIQAGRNMGIFAPAGYDPDAEPPHCYQCSEALPDGEGVERGPHVFCRACNHELDADDPTLALPVERMAVVVEEGLR